MTEPEENCRKGAYYLYRSHILLGYSNHEEEMGGTCSMRDENDIFELLLTNYSLY